MSDKMTKILEERGKQYGSYRDQAELSKKLRDIILGHMRVNTPTQIPEYMEESINMISHKIARIANGNAHNVDSWRDIGGYAILVADLLEEDETHREESAIRPATITAHKHEGQTEKAGESGRHISDTYTADMSQPARVSY